MKGGEQKMNLDLVEYQISWIEGEDIALMLEQYKALFARVREYTDNDLCAWLVAQELARVVEQAERIDRDNKESPEAKLRQLVRLKTLGITSLTELPSDQLDTLINTLSAKHPNPAK